jgi:drug/metabolite transporter (DMT)-like permease
MRLNRGVLNALCAAVLFGASTPLAKALVGEIQPVLLAGILYVGSGLGLAIWIALRHAVRDDHSWTEIAWPRGADIAWLSVSILFGGMLGPVLLMVGLTTTPASESALLLNLEAVLTALIAWFAFRENFDRSIAAGMALIVMGGLVLSWSPGSVSFSPGAPLIALACLCWAIDNNLTRRASAGDATVIACTKGLIAGSVNVGAGILMGAAVPSLSGVAKAAMVGFAGYGMSLSLFVLALRDLGTARTSAYFSVAPFFGVALAILFNDEDITWKLAVAGTFMAIGIWLHIRERHAHLHAHERQEHTHAHFHDEHHRHAHDFRWDGGEPHTHAHIHEPLVHAHPHYPDVHHRHEH